VTPPGRTSATVVLLNRLRQMLTRFRSQAGAGTLEYVGMITLAAVLVVTVAATPLASALGDKARWAVCLVVDGGGCVNPEVARSPYEQAVSGQYVAIGDSFSSGEGAGDYTADSDHDPNSGWDRIGSWFDDHLIPGEHGSLHPANFCHRSANAYGPIVASQNEFAGGSVFAACSGATTDDFENPNGSNDGEQPQLDVITDDTSLVTFSIGGNDMHFADVLADCVWDGATCEDKNEAAFANNLRDLRPRMVQMYREARERAADGARVIVVGYPRLFPDDPSNSYRNLVFAEDQRWMNAKADQLNAVLAAAAQEAGVEFVDPTGAFRGHGIGSDDPWFNDLSVGGPGWAPVNPGSFHPNAAGQAALAALVQAQLEHPR
jgi:lysophospholipase L1-like esterase